MIKAANMFVNSTTASKSHKTSKSDGHGAESVSEGEISRNDKRVKNKEVKSDEKVDRPEMPKQDSHKTSRKTRENQPVESNDETKTQDKKSKGKDENRFQQLMSDAMSDVVEEAPAETAAGVVVPVPMETGEIGELAELVETEVVEAVTPVVAGVAPGEAGQATPADMPTLDQAVPTPAVAPQTPVADVDIADESVQDLPKPVVVSPEAGAASLAEKSQQTSEKQPSVIVNTSGRPESSPIKADAPQADTPRNNVEAPASSTDAKAAATETSPNSEESGTMTPGRPVVPFSTTESPKADGSKSTEQASMEFDDSASREKSINAQTSSGKSSEQTSAESSAADGEVQTLVPPAPTQTWQAASNQSAVESQNTQPVPEQNASEKVAAVADSTSTGSRTNVESMLGQWDNTIPTSTSTSTTETVSDVAAAGGAKVADQITTHIQMRRNDLGEEMVIRLDPPELGKVRIQIRSENGELTGVIRADNPQTLAELQRESSSLMQRLNDAGVQIKTLDMQMNDMSQQGRGEQSFAQAQNAYSMFQQNNGEGRGYGYQHAGPNEPNETIQDDSQTRTSQNEQYISDSAVNVML